MADQYAKKKILVIGDIKGQFDEMFSRVQVIQEAKGTFDMLLCVGKFFNDSDEKPLEDYKTGLKKASIPTYFITTHQDKEVLTGLLGCTASTANNNGNNSNNGNNTPTNNINSPSFTYGGEICPNITYLGQQGIKEIKGLSIAFISATHDSTKKNRPMDYNWEDISSVLERTKHSQFKGVDLLLSNEWPKGLLNSLSDELCPKGISMLEYDDFGADIVAQFTASVAPRYQFASSPVKKIFFERSPYMNGPQFPTGKFAISRFFSLGDAFNTKKQRFLYAFTIQPLSSSDASELFAKPPHTTSFPFTKYLHVLSKEPAKKKQKTEDIDRARFDGQFMGDEKKPNYAQNRKRFNDNREVTKLTTGQRSEQCWFCMSNSVFEYHLIVSVAKFFYLATAKGGINDAHMLISPIKHFPNQVNLPKEVQDELDKWMTSLELFFHSRGEEVVFYEHNYPVSNQHLHIQVVPVDARDKFRVKEAFMVEGAKIKLDWITVKPGIPIEKQVDGAYFWVRLPEGTQIIAQLDKKIPFSFGRRAIASLLGNLELEDWKACIQAKLIEEKITTQLRSGFQQFQFV